MSTAAGAPSNGANAGVKSPESKNKGKAKRVVSPDVSMEEEEDEDEDEGEDEEMEEEESEEESEEEDPDIDPSVIISSGRRTRGVKVDYTSKEALEKAGLKPEDLEDDEDEDMKQMDDQ
ncbi:hypothetical protein JVT61DRAFT_13887 [Boletus reticuloceps]|uniref:Histone chaperone domain-containing protein n=1 Tax=Boletus reticuloceps TaxID=495285 RepID=A0A8I2YV52_9AGAM|nr:hypothetical protein JVT61DRAFT_13887 [Boletus reticuloceps]